MVKENETQFYNYQSLIQIQYQLCQSPMSKPEGGEGLMSRAVHGILEWEFHVLHSLLINLSQFLPFILPLSKLTIVQIPRVSPIVLSDTAVCMCTPHIYLLNVELYLLFLQGLIQPNFGSSQDKVKSSFMNTLLKDDIHWYDYAKIIFTNTYNQAIHIFFN